MNKVRNIVSPGFISLHGVTDGSKLEGIEGVYQPLLFFNLRADSGLKHDRSGSLSGQAGITFLNVVAIVPNSSVVQNAIEVHLGCSTTVKEISIITTVPDDGTKLAVLTKVTFFNARINSSKKMNFRYKASADTNTDLDPEDSAERDTMSIYSIRFGFSFDKLTTQHLSKRPTGEASGNTTAEYTLNQTN